MRGEVESRLSDFARCAEINASSVRGEVTGEVKRVVEQSQAQTLHAVGSAVQQLEKEIEVAASSATATSERATQMRWQKCAVSSRRNWIRPARSHCIEMKKQSRK